MLFRSLGILVCLLPAAWAQITPANPQWNRPFEPVHIAGDIYYVGAADVSSFLIVTPAGNILLDTGFEESVPIVESNVTKLGFQMKDIRLILYTHAHYDHSGGVAVVKAKTGAQLVSARGEAALLARGGKDDFAFGDQYAFRPAKADRLVDDGDQVSLGGTTLTAHITPGHTQFCTSWTMQVKDGGKTYHVVFPCSVTAPGYQLVNNAKYPGIAGDYKSTFAKLRALPCDIFLGSHSWDFGLAKKAEAARNGNANAFVDPEGYRRWVDRGQAAFEKELQKQRGS